MEATAFPSLSSLSAAPARSAADARTRSDWVTVPAILGDFAVVIVAMIVAFYERLVLNFGWHAKDFHLEAYWNVIAFGAVLYVILSQLNGAYVKNRLLHRSYLFRVTFKTSVMWGAVLIGFTLFFELQTNVSRIFVFWSVLNTWMMVFAWRMLFRHALFALNIASSLRSRVMVVGWSRESATLERQIADVPWHPFTLIGCTPSGHGKFHVTPPQSVPVLGDYNGLADVLRRHRPDVLILADLDPVMGELVALAQLCVKENVQFKVIPSFFQIFVSGLHLESISGVPVIGISRLPLDQLYNRMLKEALDKIGAIVGLILSAPLILVFGILIYRESPGPIFYTQARSGRGGRVFNIYKLRSMKLNAEANGPQWTKEQDPRRLKIGEFMRRTNIDEVPQFWNVLMGQMSLVGPRPERPELIENFKEEIAHYNARHFAKPGMTGYAQVNGLRGNTDLGERIRYDLYYLENWSLWLDVQIMFKTFFVRANAY